MANIEGKLIFVDHDCYVVQWGPFGESDTALYLSPALGSQIAKFTERSIQVAGNFGAGGTIALQGTNNPTPPYIDADFNILHSPFAVTLVFTTQDLQQIEEACVTYRPKITAGTGLSVYVRIYTVKQNK